MYGRSRADEAVRIMAKLTRSIIVGQLTVPIDCSCLNLSLNDLNIIAGNADECQREGDRVI